MQVHVDRIDYELDQPYRRFLTSDWHLGHVNANKGLIQQELGLARAMDARIFLNGDVFDAINPHDKRHKPSQEDAAIRGRDDKLTAMVDMAFSMCAPYADLFDVIGIGNHEEKWVRDGFSDPVGELIKRLNEELKTQGSEHRIKHGGICGYVRTVFVLGKNNKSSVSHDMLYHHGAGGDARVTKGAIDFNRAETQFAYDCLTFGHKHNSTSIDTVTLYLSKSGRIRQRRKYHVQTASYLWNYKRSSQRSPLTYSYAESAFAAPKPEGGKILVLIPTRAWRKDEAGEYSEYTVKQDAVSPHVLRHFG
jgi:hypothetical protein